MTDYVHRDPGQARALPALMTLGEVAHYTRYSTAQVRRLVDEGKLTAGRHGPESDLRFRRVDVEKFVTAMFRKKASNDQLNENNYS